MRIILELVIPFKHTLFFEIEVATASRGALNVGFTSEKKNVSKSTGIPAALKTSCTEYTSSGPTPSPGIRVHDIRASGLSAKPAC